MFALSKTLFWGYGRPQLWAKKTPIQLSNIQTVRLRNVTTKNRNLPQLEQKHDPSETQLSVGKGKSLKSSVFAEMAKNFLHAV